MSKTVFTSLTILCLSSTMFLMVLALNIQTVKASGTIYIRADGSIDPPDAPISSVDNVIYTFNDNIYDEIVVERSNIIVDGNGYTLQGSGSGKGFHLAEIHNVTIMDTNIRYFEYGIFLNSSSNDVISANNITNNDLGIRLDISSHNNSIFGNTIASQDLHGISLQQSSNNNISMNRILNTWYYSINLVDYSSNNSITGNTITTHDGWGIRLYGSSSNSISGNNITDNTRGIFLENSSNNGITENNITNNSEGIRVEATGNTISRNNITNNGAGIYLFHGSNNNSISGNDIVDNEAGMELWRCSNNKFYHNNFIDNTQQVNIHKSGYGNFWDDGYPSGGNYWSNYTGSDLYSGQHQNEVGSDGIGDAPHILDASNQDNYPLIQLYNGPVRNLNTGQSYRAIQGAINNAGEGDRIFALSEIYYEHVVVNKSLSLVGENKSNTIVNGHSTGNVIEVTASNVSLIGFTIQESGTTTNCCGIYLRESSNIIISGNRIENNWYGVWFSLSSNTTMSGNDLRNNTYGIRLSGASNNSICRNQITANKANGIWGEVSCDNIIEENSIIENNHNGIELESRSSNNSMSGNNIANNHNAGIVLGEDSSGNHVDGNNVTGNEYGLFLGLCSDNRISRNKVATNQQYGIGLSRCSNSTVSENMIANNFYGIQIFEADNNKFHHNNIINNTQQAFILTSSYTNSWDDGYPSGGNYWSDYKGVDLLGGPDQNETGTDGIGDWPYMVTPLDTPAELMQFDNYPLMGMFSDFNTTSEHHVQTVCNSTISDFHFNGTAISFTVTGEDGAVGFCRIRIPTAVMNETYKVFVNGTEVEYTLLPCSNSTHSYLYFTYNHSTQEVVIIPEFPTWISTLLILIVVTVAIAVCKRRLLVTHTVHS